MQPSSQQLLTCPTCGAALEETFGGGGGCMFCLLQAGIGSEVEGAQDSTSDALMGSTRFGVYEIDCHADGSFCELGRGAMGVTYRATDTSLQRKVALKIIKTDIAERSTDARERFVREARAAAALRHEHIATVYQFGMRLETGQYFYAMELIEGETLDDRVHRAGPLDAHSTIGIAEQVTSALAAAEKQGLVHRDLKPANLMLVNTDEHEVMGSDQARSKRRKIRALRKGGIPVVKIIDFGLAKAFHTATDPKSLTHDRFVGTPAFASPEQFEHSALDVRSDIYSLGETLWFALTGKTPFAGHTLSEIHGAQKSNALPTEQLKAAHVPHRLKSLLESMLAFEPASRPGTGELAARLQRCSPEARSVRRTRAALAVATVVVFGISTLFLAHRPRVEDAALNPAPEKSIAVLPFENLSADPNNVYFADGVQDEILTRLSKIADLKVISRTSTQHYRSTPKNLPEIAKQLGVAHILEGRVQKSGDVVRVNVQLIKAANDSHLWADTFDRKLTDLLSVESEVAKAIAEQLSVHLTGREQQVIAAKPTDNPEAYNAYLRGLGIEQGQSSGSSFQDAAKIYAEAVQLDPNFALAWARLSIVRSFLYYHSVDPKLNSAAAVKEAADRAIALAPELGEAWLAQGTYRSRVLNDPTAALQAYREAEKRLPNSALVNEYMAYAERRLGRWREAEAHLARAIELDPRNARLWTNAASDVFWPLGRATEAAAALDRALEISPNDEFVIALKADQYQQEGRLDEAAKELARIAKDSTDKTVLIHRVDQAVLERNFDEAILWAKKATSSPSPGQALNTQDIFALVLQGYCQLWAGRNEEARVTFQGVIQEVAPGGVLPPSPILAARLYLAAAYAGLGDKSNAHEQARRGVAEYENDALFKPIAEAFRAKALTQLGEVDAAIDALPHLLEVPGGIHPGELRYSPYWDPLRNDPRFEELLKNPPPVRY